MTYRTPANILSAFANNPVEAKGLQKVLVLWERMRRLFLQQQEAYCQTGNVNGRHTFWARAQVYSALVIERFERSIGTRTDTQETQDYLRLLKAYKNRHKHSPVNWAVYDEHDMPLISLILPHFAAYRAVPSFRTELSVSSWAVDLSCKLARDRFLRPLYAAVLAEEALQTENPVILEQIVKDAFDLCLDYLIPGLEARSEQGELLQDLIQAHDVQNVSDQDIFNWWRNLPLGVSQ